MPDRYVPRRNAYGVYRPGDGRRLISNGPLGFTLDRRLFPGGRQGLIDVIQPVFGYFAGGGWAFGMAERTGQRFTAASYTRYLSGQTSFLVEVYNERTGAISSSIALQSINPNAENYILPSVQLRPLDRAAVNHDLAFAQALRANLAGGSLAARLAAEAAANADLIAAIDAPITAYPGDPDLVEYEMAYRSTIRLGLVAHKRMNEHILNRIAEFSTSAEAYRAWHQGMYR